MAKPWYRGPWQRIRKQILERDHYECQIKGPHCTFAADQVDHITQVQDGGAWWDERNLRASCTPCNAGRRPTQHVAPRQW